MADYNGWTNYATWRVNLEVFDGMELEELFRRKPELGDLAEWAKEYVQEILECNTKEGLALDYARAFVSDVSYWELAKNWLDNYWEEEEEEEAA